MRRLVKNSILQKNKSRINGLATLFGLYIINIPRGAVYQMSIDLVNLSYKQKNINSSEQSVLTRLSWHADINCECYPSIRSISVDTKLNRKTVQQSLVSLEEKKLIIKTGKMRGKTKSVPVYKLNLSDPNLGFAKKVSDPVFSISDPKIGTAKRSQKRYMERSDLKDQRKDGFVNSSGPKTLKNIIEKLKVGS